MWLSRGSTSQKMRSMCLLNGSPRASTPIPKTPRRHPPLLFDLVTFPEAFLPVERLLEILKYVGRLDSFGCVHVGLRPSAAELNHLFLTSELKALLSELRSIPGILTTDLDFFFGMVENTCAAIVATATAQQPRLLQQVMPGGPAACLRYRAFSNKTIAQFQLHGCTLRPTLSTLLRRTHRVMERFDGSKIY
jgi:hypothetical protein